MELKEQIFKLLNIKPNEEFKINSPFFEKDEKLYTYKLKETMVVEYKDSYGRWNPDWTILPKLLNGEASIKKIIIPTKEEQIAIDYAKLLGYKWLAKDKSGEVCGYIEKPSKSNSIWSSPNGEYNYLEYNNISFLSFEDNEPYYIGE
jgi:hypothetical protein